ncbi:heme NO-binding domain-containing protein [uncultured Pseudoteredinibacter sp.]|uniref:heme NO-binding domain-containing protein n=1 Tax=uncultured Pseudoteredinibacter sp. TaxID=1641701 RepID=UPI002605916C|nr:heme NO-binding domain-containing protein [uncultured Pseudoteredinibacter sp.]
MKGVVFTNFAELVEDNYGLAMWQNILDTANPPSGGIYVATAQYDDQELISLVGAASELLDMPAPVLIRRFGQFLWQYFEENYPQFITSHDNLFDFLISVDSVIHMEVNKLYPNASTPDFEYDRESPKQLLMHYRSPRKLCHLSVGLIEASANYYQTPIRIEHPVCMHEGSDHCEIRVTIADG